jgi:hypothetical protein
MGAINVTGPERFAALPQEIIKNTPISLWSTALEIHTGRIYHFLIGDFYVLIVPLTGLVVLFILISGLVVWLNPFFTGKKPTT